MLRILPFFGVRSISICRHLSKGNLLASFSHLDLCRRMAAEWGILMKNKQKDKPQGYEHVIFTHPNTVASVTEFTGLIQIPPVDDEEIEAYSDIYAVPEQINYMLKDVRTKDKIQK